MKIRSFILVIPACLILSTALAQADQTNFKFDFGSGKAAPGYTKVTASTNYSKEQGYGFDFGSAVAEIDRGGKDLLKADFITSDKPFYFSVHVPEGNYKITVTLGD